MNTPKVPKPETGLRRLRKALFYSLSGIRLAFSDEAAFRQEVLLVFALSVLSLVLPIEPWLRGILIFSHCNILIVELLNTSIESIVDKTSPEYHHQAKKAKDTGSAAVLLAMIASGGLWCYALWSIG